MTLAWSWKLPAGYSSTAAMLPVVSVTSYFCQSPEIFGNRRAGNRECHFPQMPIKCLRFFWPFVAFTPDITTVPPFVNSPRYQSNPTAFLDLSITAWTVMLLGVQNVNEAHRQRAAEIFRLRIKRRVISRVRLQGNSPVAAVGDSGRRIFSSHWLTSSFRLTFSAAFKRGVRVERDFAALPNALQNFGALVTAIFTG